MPTLNISHMAALDSTYLAWLAWAGLSFVMSGQNRPTDHPKYINIHIHTFLPILLGHSYTRFFFSGGRGSGTRPQKIVNMNANVTTNPSPPSLLHSNSCVHKITRNAQCNQAAYRRTQTKRRRQKTRVRTELRFMFFLIFYGGPGPVCLS